MPSSVLISRREWLLVGVVVGLVVALVSWPSVSGITKAPPATTYLGTNVPDVLDSQVYYAFIQANADGQTLYTNQFTAEDQPAVLFNPLWWTLGRLVVLTNWAPSEVFLFTKAVFGASLIIGLYRIISAFFLAIRWRLLGLVLAVFGGGLGWLALSGLTAQPGLIWVYQNPTMVSVLPVDLTYAVGYLWLAIYHSPLYVFSIGLLIWIGWMTWRSFVRPRLIHFAGAATLLLGLTHPYDLIFLAGVVASFVVIGIIGNLADQAFVKKLFQRCLTLGLWALPAIVYYTALLVFVPVIRSWNDQNILLTSNLRTVLAGFAPTIFFVIIGLRRWWRDDRQRVWLLTAWVAAAFVLLYFPLVRYQAKMIIGLSIPLAILATAGLRAMAESARGRTLSGRIGLTLASVFIILTPGFFFARVVQSQTEESQRFYVDDDLLAALRWIQTSTPPEAIILGDVWTGNLVPQYARRATYLGHHHQTANFESKLQKVREWFYQDKSNLNEKHAWLNDQRIDYIIFGPNEQRQGSFDPRAMTGLERVFLAGDVQVWRVGSALGE